MKTPRTKGHDIDWTYKRKQLWPIILSEDKSWGWREGWHQAERVHVYTVDFPVKCGWAAGIAETKSWSPRHVWDGWNVFKMELYLSISVYLNPLRVFNYMYACFKVSECSLWQLMLTSDSWTLPVICHWTYQCTLCGYSFTYYSVSVKTMCLNVFCKIKVIKVVLTTPCHTLLFKRFVVSKITLKKIYIFLNKVLYVHQGCIYLIKNTVKTVI